MGKDFEAAIKAIDQFNSEDPRSVETDGASIAEEVLYSRRMSEMLRKLQDKPSPELQIAVHAQHIGRWKIPRSKYPEGRTGYLKWKAELLQFHAERTAEILRSCGYPDPEITKIGEIIRKLGMNRNPDSQALEDTACLVFIQYYLEDFLKKHEADKIKDIIAKTWKRMSDHGHSVALKLELSGTVRQAIQSALG